MSITSEIGIMQGRLSPKIDGKIQAFPVENWKNEFKFADAIGFNSIEWIVENPLLSNPIFDSSQIGQIKEIMEETKIKIDFICADIFMQAPITHEQKVINDSIELIKKIIASAKKVGAKYIEIPFVDNSSLRGKNYMFLVDFFNSLENTLIENEICINLETDLNPLDFKKLLDEINLHVGANYDIGNSASLGYNFLDEMESYASRINNVHVKDRILGGSTVEFGTGNANISAVIEYLALINYDKGIIIQGARGEDDFNTAKSQYHYTKNLIEKFNEE